MLPEKKGAAAGPKGSSPDEPERKPAARPHQRYSKSEFAAICLSRVLVDFGLPAPQEEIRRNLDGAICRDDITNFLDVAETYGLQGRPVVLTSAEWRNIPSMSILHWGPDHLVVFESRVGDLVIVHDPATGTREVGRDEFRRLFTGVVLVFDPASPCQD